MRIPFSNLNRPKAAAKLLVRSAGHVKLSQAQEAVARATGYRDWHDLAQEVKEVARPEPNADLAHTLRMILAISDQLGIADSEVQYALSRSRLMGRNPLPLPDSLKLRTMIWRERLFGPPARGKPGTIIRVKERGNNRPAYLKSLGRPAYLIYDTGYGMCADFEVVTPRVPLEDFAPSRLWLPYGYWTLRDHSTVTFARDYKPMWRVAGGVIERLDPWLWINEIEEEAHFMTLAGTRSWSHGPARELALEHLKQHRLFELPRLLDAMPHLFESKVESVGGAVERMRKLAEAA